MCFAADVRGQDILSVVRGMLVNRGRRLRWGASASYHGGLGRRRVDAIHRLSCSAPQACLMMLFVAAFVPTNLGSYGAADRFDLMDGWLAESSTRRF